MMRKILSLFLVISFITSCGVRLKQPFKTETARLGETSTIKTILLDSIYPIAPIIVGVYKFRDQTGQYKQLEIGSSWSTAVTQGATTILMKALEDSKWFIPLERENLSNLLNERQIIRSTRKEYNGDSVKLAPLLFASVILEGGVISYDSNIRTGGIGARYFGAGASSKYREDRITIYLRAVSTSNGQVLKTVYVSKTILSQAISANLFRYVDVKKIVEAEVGITQNEPKQLAVKEAIDKAVEYLTIEGILDGIWQVNAKQENLQELAVKYSKEVEEAERTKLFQREYKQRRRAVAITGGAGGIKMDGDYSNVALGSDFRIGLKTMFNNPNFSLNFEFAVIDVESVANGYSGPSYIFDTNLEYLFLPYEDTTPYIYGGAGVLAENPVESYFFKIQGGAGVEYMPFNNVSFRVFGEYNISFTDDLDGVSRGKRDDYFWKFGVGISYYFGKFKNKKE